MMGSILKQSSDIYYKFTDPPSEKSVTLLYSIYRQLHKTVSLTDVSNLGDLSDRVRMYNETCEARSSLSSSLERISNISLQLGTKYVMPLSQYSHSATFLIENPC